eukprot:Plantae.Rhodophyta-Hildenbrandia_rubra.ctg6359.p1 GENE.Plantae.Rhodophyta-Hildenbrandia_rubra.ctg6359~~Plantae.Rhodophyta-Hildenbrandia_rubra.ctg6359.p1  ORF type:complete len:569 (-),score=77.09 Plantae.Rhodophyta-Hildenbrandia_rubra.ctg6359:328-2034(-)
MDDGKSGPLYLGLDLSTQSLTATLLTNGLQVTLTSTVSFKSDLPTFTPVNHDPPTKSATSPTAMFLAALDMLLSRMQEASIPFDRIVSLSASAQQHGSVYFCDSSSHTLQGLNSTLTLYEQLLSAFTIPDGPIWLDASTTRECKELEGLLGGANALAQRTGSRAYERYTASQIMKIMRTKPEEYSSTGHISLISSFFASLFIGKYAPEDVGDASGMNLMDIHSNPPVWDAECMSTVDPSGALESKLCDAPVLSHEIVGEVSQYFVKRYGFNEKCKVVAFSGDNPNTVVGMRLSVDGDWLCSLGTSDVVCTVTAQANIGTMAHVFRSPLAPLSYLPLVCYANGSLTRQAVRDGKYSMTKQIPTEDNSYEKEGRSKTTSWDEFDELVAQTNKATCVGLFHLVPEICPRANATPHPILYKPSLPLTPLSSPPTYAELCRAVLESRALAMLAHGIAMGFAPPTRVLAAGGAAASKSLLQCLADALGCNVYTVEDTANGGAAAFGAAVRAAHGVACDKAGKFVPFEQVWGRANTKDQGLKLAAKPDISANRIYKERLLPVFKAAEARVQSDHV